MNVVSNNREAWSCPLPYQSKVLCRAASLILRGANDFMVDEMERSVHDALCVVKRVLESHLVVPGAGLWRQHCLCIWRTLREHWWVG